MAVGRDREILEAGVRDRPLIERTDREALSDEAGDLCPER